MFSIQELKTIVELMVNAPAASHGVAYQNKRVIDKVATLIGRVQSGEKIYALTDLESRVVEKIRAEAAEVEKKAAQLAEAASNSKHGDAVAPPA